MTARRWPRWLRRGLLVLVGGWLALEAGAWLVLHARVNQPLAQADRVVIRVDSGTSPRLEKTVADPATMARLRAFVNARPGGWARTWHTPPVTRVHVTFYRGDEVVGWLAAGQNFLQAPSRGGVAAMRRARPAELEELNRLLGIPPQSHRWPRRYETGRRASMHP